MKERPILFSSEMVRALLAGTKTQTRRVMTPQPFQASTGTWFWSRGAQHHVWSEKPFPHIAHDCKYGDVGDRLWVKETFFPVVRSDPRFAAVKGDYVYRTDYEYREPERSVISPHKWKPSISCTRAASRITIELTAVRIDRLNDIIPADVQAEGCPYKFSGFSPEDAPDFIGWYRNLWESINGAGSWALNPFVWVLEFKRIT